MAKPTKDAQAPWTIRGVTHEARAAALKAAELSGQKTGDWLSRVIQEAAAGEIKESRAVGKTAEQMATEMAQRMEDFTKAQQSQAEATNSVLQRLTERLEAVEQGRRQGFFKRLFGARDSKAPAPTAPPTKPEGQPAEKQSGTEGST